MPLVTVVTAEPVEREKARELLSDLSAKTAELLGKPERFVACQWSSALAMTFAGSPAPACIVQIANIGALGPAQTERMSRTLCAALSEALGIAPDRVYVIFREVERHLWGSASGTFA